MTGVWLSLLLAVIVPVPLAYGVGRARPDWGLAWVVLAAATPLPLVGSLASLFPIVEALTASRDQCGYDVCGFLFATGMLGVACSLAVLVVGGMLALLSEYEGGRR